MPAHTLATCKISLGGILPTDTSNSLRKMSYTVRLCEMYVHLISEIDHTTPTPSVTKCIRVRGRGKPRGSRLGLLWRWLPTTQQSQNSQGADMIRTTFHATCTDSHNPKALLEPQRREMWQFCGQTLVLMLGTCSNLVLGTDTHFRH